MDVAGFVLGVASFAPFFHVFEFLINALLQTTPVEANT
jgi:hypothetical protein